MDSISNFSIGPELVPRSLAVLRSFTSIIFYYVGQTLLDVQWRNTENEMLKSIMKRQVFFNLVVLEWLFVLFLRKGLLHPICSLLCYLFMQKNVQTDIKGKTLRSSHSQTFFEIGALKNLAIFARKHMCWSLFLIKLKPEGLHFY